MRVLVSSTLGVACAVSTLYAAQSSRPAGGVDPCALVTKQEAAAAVGEAVGDGKPTTVVTNGPAMQGGGSCQFESPSSAHYVKINLYRYPEQIAAAYRQRCSRKETAPSIGDVACWYDSNHKELQLLNGTTSLAIQISRSGDASEALKKVAKQAADRLP
jgi:hypothetical protein